MRIRSATILGLLLVTAACKGDGNDAGANDGTETGINPTTTTGDGGALPCDPNAGDTQCSDGIDNDDDGLVDDEDPECTGPCDDDEASFATGIPGDNKDCKQDCFFDGDSGAGNDGCEWSIKCDPENPGAGTKCEYTGGKNCENAEAMVPPECLDVCLGLVPNGCDCFGCCTVETPDGDVNVYLGSGEDCSLANLDACKSCTPQESCWNPCEADECEVCFGEDAPPEGCDEPKCPDGVEPCMSQGEGEGLCPDGKFCVTGCCVEYTPPP